GRRRAVGLAPLLERIEAADRVGARLELEVEAKGPVAEDRVRPRVRDGQAGLGRNAVGVRRRVRFERGEHPVLDLGELRVLGVTPIDGKVLTVSLNESHADDVLVRAEGAARAALERERPTVRATYRHDPEDA